MIAGSLFLCYNAVKRKGESHMWTRKDLKTIGKAALHRNYWVTVLVTLIYGFQSGHYGKNTLTLFLRGLYSVLWTLLLIVPGIIPE